MRKWVCITLSLAAILPALTANAERTAAIAKPIPAPKVDMVAFAKSRADARELLQAVQADQADHVLRLLTRHVPVDARDGMGRTPLMQAARNGNARLAALLLKAGAQVNKASRVGRTPLMEAAFWSNNDMVSLLLAHHANVNAADTAGATALMAAAERGETDRQDASGTQSQRRCPRQKRQYPLMVAAAWLRLGTIDLLLNSHADANARKISTARRP